MTNRVKYPRTPHLPWSPGATSDDRVLQNVDHFKDKIVSVSVKMDGENTTLYRDAMHARSIDSKDHPSRHKLKAAWANYIRWDIPEGWRFVLENCTAVHSIHYLTLPALWFGLSIWDTHNLCQEDNYTRDLFTVSGIHVPRLLYYGLFDEKKIQALDIDYDEGYVVRLTEAFHYDDFEVSVAKYVRPNHVQTDKHWQHGVFIENRCVKPKLYLLSE